MLYLIFVTAIVFTIWMGWELYRAPTINDDSSIDDPTATCWHNDDEDLNHTEGPFH